MKTLIKHSKRNNEDTSDFQVKKKLKIKNKEKITNKLKNKKLKEIQEKQPYNKKNEIKNTIINNTDSSESLNIIKSEKKKNRQDESIISSDSTKFASALSEIILTVDSFNEKDPVLSHCKLDIAKKIQEKNIENKARTLISVERKKEKEKGRIKDIVPINDDEKARKTLEYEKSLQKIAQKGVINLFNTIRTIQIKTNNVSRETKKKLMDTSKKKKEGKNLMFTMKYQFNMIQSQKCQNRTF
ncbi:hypothetical protein PMAC_002653 [Pneumocystis sp. 'macacae']|nr:hypothetical protein PMAC_002653 [Pneumocystis sp. 'macacae']